MEKSMKKVIVSTFNNSKNNYGALFQSCGMSYFLKRLGYDVSFITINKRDGKVPASVRIKIVLKKILTVYRWKSIRTRRRKFEEFAQATQTQIGFETVNDLMKNPPSADAYISGSDQVWNPIKLNLDFLLAYAPDKAKKVAYAASMGNEKIPVGTEEVFSRYIKRYDAISVREDTMLSIIGKYTDVPVHQNIDPVFLMTKDEWRGLSKPYKKLKYDKYILVYAIYWNSKLNTELQNLKMESGLPIVSINIDNINMLDADQVVFDASPEEFLFLLDKCQYVVASSFHGIAMSIIFNKPFTAIAGEDKPSRIESLMRHFPVEEPYSFDPCDKNTDYMVINDMIKKDALDAETFIRGSIEQ